MIKHLQIICPGLESVPTAWLAEVDCPYLQHLIRVADAVPNPFSHAWDKLTDLFKLQQPLPAAAFLASAFHHQKAGYWYLLVNPVEYQADLKTIYCLGGQHLAIQAKEAEWLIQTFRALLPLNMDLIDLDPHQWLIACPDSYDLLTSPLANSVHRASPPILLRGQDATSWQCWLTELQMSWHGSWVNNERSRQGLSTVNAVWLSGEGCLPDSKPTNDWPVIYSDDPVTQGLGQWMGSSVHAWPAREGVNKICDQTHPQVLVVLQRLAMHIHNKEQWHQLLADLEQTLFKPIWQELRSGGIHAVNLCLGGHFDYHILRRQTWRFWRQQRPLESEFDLNSD